MLMADDIDNLLVEAGIAPDSAAIKAQWQAHVSATLKEATLDCPPMDSYMQQGGKQGLLREDGRILYPVDDGIPVMLVEESIEIEASATA